MKSLFVMAMSFREDEILNILDVHQRCHEMGDVIKDSSQKVPNVTNYFIYNAQEAEVLSLKLRMKGATVKELVEIKIQ